MTSAGPDARVGEPGGDRAPEAAPEPGGGERREHAPPRRSGARGPAAGVGGVGAQHAHGRSATRVITSTARRSPSAPASSRRRSASTSPASPRRRTSSGRPAPEHARAGGISVERQRLHPRATPRTGSAPARRRRGTRSAGRPAGRRRAPRGRTTPRRGSRRGWGPAGRPRRPHRRLRRAARDTPAPAAPRARPAGRPEPGPHSAASLRSRPSATNSTSQPAGTAARSSPGAAFTTGPAARWPRGAAATTQRYAAARRAGSTNAPAHRPGSARRDVGAGHRPAGVVLGQQRVHRVTVDPGRRQAGGRERREVAADAAAQVEHGRARAQRGGQPRGPVRRHRERGGLLQTGAGQQLSRPGEPPAARPRSSTWPAAAASSPAAYRSRRRSATRSSARAARRAPRGRRGERSAATSPGVTTHRGRASG